MFHFFFGSVKNAVIVCKFEKGYRMYFWNLETDEITSGQWLMRGRLVISKCFVSEDCTYFKYKWREMDNIHEIISRVPYFSAISVSGYNDLQSWENVVGLLPESVNWSQFVTLTDKTLQGIYVDNMKILRGDKVILDVTGSQFSPVEANYGSISRSDGIKMTRNFGLESSL
jgi:hypothetical protein